MNNSTLISASMDFVNASMNHSNELHGKDLEYWEEILSDSRYLVQRILVPILLIIGTFGNSITIAVMTRRHMQTSTNVYLTALAISDILYLVFTFSLSLIYIPGMSHRDNAGYWHFYRYALWLTDASSNTSNWLTVTFTIERYIAVCHPMKGKVFCTQSRAKRVIITVYLIFFLLTVTTPHEWTVVPDIATNGTHVRLQRTDLGKNETYDKLIHWFSAVMIVLPLILLAAFNTFLILAVKRSRRQRTTMTSLHRDTHAAQENKITVMLIAVVLLALTCQLPTAAMLIYNSYSQQKEKTLEYFVCRMLNNFFNLLIGVNAAANFIFYCALSDRYRRTFLQTFCRKWYQRYSPPPSWMATGYTNFEDGSPRASLRGSSMRASRRSSYRSSPSSTPRASPSHTSLRHSDRHHGGPLLKVPPFTFSATIQEDPIPEMENEQSQIVPPVSCYSPLVKHTFHNGSAKELRIGIVSLKEEPEESSDELDNDPMKISLDKEIASQMLENQKRPSNSFDLRRLFANMRSKRSRKPDTQLSRSKNILIKCQPPSIEEQTAV